MASGNPTVENGALLNDLMRLFLDARLKTKLSAHKTPLDAAVAALPASSCSESLTSPRTFTKELQQIANTLRRTELHSSVLDDLREHAPTTAAQLEQGFKEPSQLPLLLNVLQSDAELAPLLREIDSLGALAFVTFWQKPEMMGRGEATTADLDDGDQDSHTTDDEQELSLHAAVMDGDQQLVHDLLLDGSDVNELDEEGRTALHNASAMGEHGCMLNLLSAGADVNALDNKHNTALHYAAGYGEYDSVLILLKNGTDPTLRNIDGHTALQLAKLNHQADVIEVLDKSLVKE